MATTCRLSKAQLDLLRRLENASERTPPTGTVASGWYRTVESLERLGFVAHVREGDGWRAHLTAVGAAYLAARCEKA